ncbi:MAG: hypothetical protein O7G83_22245 [Proteobacteria bacterium]|nr:hypothetical protein [Pseudomonadota bacterium]
MTRACVLAELDAAIKVLGKALAADNGHHCTLEIRETSTAKSLTERKLGRFGHFEHQNLGQSGAVGTETAEETHGFADGDQNAPGTSRSSTSVQGDQRVHIRSESSLDEGHQADRGAQAIAFSRACQHEAEKHTSYDATLDVDDLIERFCIQSVDGDLDDAQAFEAIAFSQPLPPYDALLDAITEGRLPTPEDHREAIARWLEIAVDQQHVIRNLFEHVVRERTNS